MALGLTYGGGGDFLDIVKYDARAGRMSRVDNLDGVKTPKDITATFKAVFDFENVEVGWIDFTTGGAPSFALVSLDTPLPPRPTAEHKQGMRIVLKLAPACAGDAAPIRELAGTSAALLGGIDALHGAYLDARAANPGKLPVVSLLNAEPVTTGSGAKKSTNYKPEFAIVGWTNRPADLVASPRVVAPASGTPASATSAAPRTAAAPVPVTIARAPVSADADDFG